MAIAIRMAMISTTTMSSISVKPRSSRSRRFRSTVSTGWVPPGQWMGASPNPEVPARTPSYGRRCALLERVIGSSLDQVDDVEHRHVERDDHAAHRATHEHDQQGLEERRQGVDHGLDLLVVEVGDAVE